MSDTDDGCGECNDTGICIKVVAHEEFASMVELEPGKWVPFRVSAPAVFPIPMPGQMLRVELCGCVRDRLVR